jgi:signal transduction histidine kinase/ligand-binding sensor domain-containing protein
MTPTQGQGLQRFLSGLLLAGALIGLPAPAAAAGPALQISQYAHTSWTARDGANMGLVFAMAQTPDGYLWVAGLFGLYRFDGHKFERWQPPNGQSLPSNPYSLLVSRDGTLWIGTFEGLSSWNGREFVPRYPEIAKGFVTSLHEDRDGTVWAGAIDRDGTLWAGVHTERALLCAVRGAQVRCTAPEGQGFGNSVWSVAEDRAGALWVASGTGVWRWRPGPPQRYPVPGEHTGDLTTTADGDILFGVRGGGLRQVVGGRVVPHRFALASRPGEWLADRHIKSNKLLRDRDGGLWIGTEGLGLMRVKDGQAYTFSRADGLTGNIACSLFEDREGNVWYGSERSIDRFRKQPVAALSTKQGLPSDYASSVLAAADGSVWVATNDGLARWTQDRFTVYRERDGLPNARVHSLYEDAEGQLWASTAGGLARFAGGRFVAVAGIPKGEIFAISGDAAGRLWLSSETALVQLQRGRVVASVPWSLFGRPRQAQAVIADRGGVWVAFWDGSGVFFFKDGRIEASYTAAEGLGAGHVAGLRLDATGAVWAAMDEDGLSRIKDGRVTTLTVANGLPCNKVQWSMVDDQGSLWLYMSCGLVRVGADDVAAWTADPSHRVTPKLWNGADGVPALMGGQASFTPTVAKGRDGRLWFVAGAELEWIDPANMPFNPVPPPVHIMSLVVDLKPYAVTDGLSLPPMVRDIAIGFSALSLADPTSVRYRYWLEGHDTAWQEGVDRRLASYTNLPPGNYRFRVKAANNSGVWNEQGASLEFSIQPAFHQTTWFRIGLAVLLVGLAWSGFQLWLHLRMRRLHRQFETTVEARVAERMRIARDLHDTLLQHLHALLLHFQAASNLLPDRPNDSKRILRGAIDLAAQAITEGRDTVRGLRSPVSQQSDLVDALRALAGDLADKNAQAVALTIDVQGQPQPLPPLIRDEIFHTIGEALRNAFHHAAATQIDVKIHYNARELRVTVHDDGSGIDPELLRKGGKRGHFGLSGMRERAELAGGHLTIRSTPGEGTDVDLRVPASRAYGRSPQARRWFPGRKSSSDKPAE